MQGEVGQGQDLSASFYFSFSFSLVDVEFWNIRSFAPVASQWIPFLLRLAIGSRCQHWHQIGTTAADNKNLQEQNFRKQQCNIQWYLRNNTLRSTWVHCTWTCTKTIEFPPILLDFRKLGISILKRTVSPSKPVYRRVGNLKSGWPPQTFEFEAIPIYIDLSSYSKYIQLSIN